MSESARGTNHSQVLDDVRRALGRNTTRRPTPLDAFVEPSVDVNTEDLVARFTGELTAVGGHVYRMSDILQLVAAVAEICQAAKVAEVVTEVALSKSTLITELELPDQLTARGLSVFVPEAAGAAEHDQLVGRLASCVAGVTAVEYAIAETGTIVLCSEEGNALLVSLLPAIHIALVRTVQISASLDTVIGALGGRLIEGGKHDRDPYRSATMITGPSRTSDVELTLSIGVHGPKELHVIILD